jgi:WD40 repeat protein
MRLAVAGDAGEQLRLRQPSGEFIRLTGHEGPVAAVAFAPDGRTLLSGGTDGAVILWRVEDGAELARFEGHMGKVTCVAFAPDGRVAYSGSSDGTVRRWPLP